jgi:hypothetical protein
MDNSQHYIGLDIQTAVEVSGLGRTKLYEAIKHGLLPVRKYGRRTIIIADDLKDFLKALPIKEAA